MNAKDRKFLYTVLISTVVLFIFLYFARRVMTPFFIAFAVAYLLDPLVDKLETWKLSRTTSVVALLSSFFLITFVASLIFIPLFRVQVHNLAENLPDYLTAVKGWFQPFLEQVAGIDKEKIQEILQEGTQKLGELPVQLLGTATQWLWSSINSVVNAILVMVNIVIIPVAMFYLLRDFDDIVERVGNLVPPRFAEQTTDVAKEIDSVLSQFVRGQLMVATFMAVLYSLGLLLCGTPMSLFIGMLAGYANLVPYLGLVLGFVPAVLLTFLKFQTWQSLVGVVLVFGVVQALEGMVFTPRVVGDKVGLHPVVIMLAVLVGAELFGLLGVLLAVPVAAVLNVLARRGLLTYKKSSAFS